MSTKTISVYLPEDTRKQVEASPLSPRELIERGLAASEPLADKVEHRCDALARLLQNAPAGQDARRVAAAVQVVIDAAREYVNRTPVSPDHE